MLQNFHLTHAYNSYGRRKAESVKERRDGHEMDSSKKSKAKPEVVRFLYLSCHLSLYILIMIMIQTPMIQAQSNKCTSEKYKPLEDDCGTGFPIEPPRVELRKGISHSNSVVHPNAVGYSHNKRVKDDGSNSALPRALSTSQHGSGFSRQGSHLRPALAGSSNRRSSGNGQASNNDSAVCFCVLTLSMPLFVLQ